MSRRSATRREALFSLASLPVAVSVSASTTTTTTKATKLLFGGDVILARGVAAKMGKSGLSPLRELAAKFQAADIAFVNLESPFSDRPQIWQAEMVFRAEPAAIQSLVDAGIDIVSTANNHVRDCGKHGIDFTLDLLAKHRIVAIGTGADENVAYAGTVMERNGVKFGFLGYTFDQANGNHRDVESCIAMMDVKRMQTSVATLRSAGKADVVIVSMHAGVEYAPKPHKMQIDFARAAIDAGAKLVIGHHPHVVQTFEMYKSGVIFYSLGNLVFDQNPPETKRGMLVEAVFQGSQCAECTLIPVDIVDTVPRVSASLGASTLLLNS
jgi:poly-gamma-glutamate capsule biosynthesis protein CapA/YwtB (metallophosphatase superfamily)